MPDALPRLRPFTPDHAARVAAWVRTDAELNWLSPDTAPPMTPARVLDWGGRGHRQFLMHLADKSPPMGYAELNDMPSSRTDLWLGHVLLDPAHRGRGLGAACVRSAIVHAFDELAAEQVILVVVPENNAAIRAYESAGFQHRGDEWKTLPGTSQTYRLLRMTIDRQRYYDLCAAGQITTDLL